MNTRSSISQQTGAFIQLKPIKLTLAFLFLVGVWFYTLTLQPQSTDHLLLVIAAMMGGYMAMNIGANDVANNVGPAVGSGAMTLVTAIVIAVVFESAGAIIAGGDVVSTIKKGIINPDLIADRTTFIYLMISALMAGALWLNLATAIGAPVSTTHSIVGGVLGAGIAAGGWDIANWDRMGAIAASWVISPVLGGIIAATFLWLIKRHITYKENMILAAKRQVPYLVAMMALAFSIYLAMKGFKKLIKLDLITSLGIGVVVAITTFFIVRPLIARAANRLKNSKKSVNSLFTVPLIFAAALLSFAHGANDVANAVGPLAAINDALLTGDISNKAAIPLWIMVVGAAGIAIGLALFGPKLIHTVGTEITELDKMRAFCVAMAAAITVIIASKLGLPVSSTHIAVGGIFGIGFLREHIKHKYINNDVANSELAVALAHPVMDATVLKGAKPKKVKKPKKPRPMLVKRSALYRIAAAWLITVPASAVMAAMIFFTIQIVTKIN